MKRKYDLTYAQCEGCGMQRLHRGSHCGECKQKVRRKTEYAVKIGRLIKAKVCEKCQTETKLQSHHPSYLEPYKIMWLCKPCHSHEDMLTNKTDHHRDFFNAMKLEQRT